MTTKDIRIYGNPILRRKADPVEEFDANLQAMVDDMFATMIAADGIGLAAPQVGISKQFLVIGMPRDNEEEIDRLFFANPKITETQGESSYDEGCLSVPGIRAEVLRPQWIRLQYKDIKGEEHTLEDDDLLARVLQHEIDHLNGILFIDRISAAKRALLKKALQKLAATGKAPDNVPTAFADSKTNQDL